MRTGINASAGGVIAYGLTEMIRMINHGTISSTDVARGIIGYNNQASFYHYLNPLSNVSYRFRRNMSGAYNFTVVTLKYKTSTGVISDKLTVNERYHYQIYMIPRGMSETEDWFVSQYKLPNMNQDGFTGVYYHVTSPSQNPIIRELAIVIVSETRDQKWGLYDDYATWD